MLWLLSAGIAAIVMGILIAIPFLAFIMSTLVTPVILYLFITVVVRVLLLDAREAGKTDPVEDSDEGLDSRW